MIVSKLVETLYMMNVSESTVQFSLDSWWVLIGKEETTPQRRRLSPKLVLDLFQPIRRWLERIEVRNPKLAHSLCRVIPAQCPFERHVTFWGYTLHIPPLCKLNPLYQEIVDLRFRSLCYLADACGEDVTPYC